MRYKPRPYQEEAAKRAVEFLTDDTKVGNGLIVASTGCHAKGTKILMADGSLKNVEDIVVGDRVMGNGVRTVLALHRGTDMMYEITPIKGEPFVVNKGHILSLYRTRMNRNVNAKIVNISVEEFLKASKTEKHLLKLYRRNLCEFENESTSFPIPPYLLGLLIGDGSMRSGALSITTMRKEVRDYIFDYAKENHFRIRVVQKKNNKSISYHIADDETRKNRIIDSLRELGLYDKTAGDKFIPERYKRADIRSRMELLGGLLDTDAYYDAKRRTFEYCTKSKRLAEDITFLCRSLGVYALFKEKYVNGVCYYRSSIVGDSAIPTKVGIRHSENRRQKKRYLVTGFSIREIGVGDYYGFTLDGDHLYCDGNFIMHHNSGKSIIISEIAERLNANVLVFCPSKEILQQNYSKMLSYGVECGMYSASVRKKEIAKITFATIGSIKNKAELFRDFEYILIDEAHGVNPEQGMYFKFMGEMKKRMVGLTATPYRLETTGQVYCYKEKKMDLSNAVSRLIPIVGEGQMFGEVIYNIDTQYLLDQGYLARIRYFSCKPAHWDEMRIFKNSSNSDFSQKSLGYAFDMVGMNNYVVNVIGRLLKPKSGIPRRGILVFVRNLEEAEAYASFFGGKAMWVSGKTSKKNRERILEEFKSGELKILLNVGVLVTGFDYPELDTVVLASPTMSLAKYYQEVGRAQRPFEGKDAWVVDLVGNFDRFGEVHRIRFEERNGQWDVYNDYRQLTNVEL